jgi:hypothetical protein
MGEQITSVSYSVFRNTHGAPLSGKKGRPRNPQHNQERIQSPAKENPLAVEAPSRIQSSSKQNLDNMKLLDHFMTRNPDNPDSSQNSSAPGRDPLHHQALLLSFEYPCILHLIYEFSALDIARQQPTEEAHYRSLGEQHSFAGLRGATDLIRRMDEDDCHAIYTASTLACINFLARGPQVGEYLIFSEIGPPQWLPLIWGIRTIIDMVGLEKISTGPLGKGPDKSPRQASELGAQLFKCPRLDWIDHFEGLQVFVAASTDQDSAMDLDALQKLSWCYTAMYGKEDGISLSDVNQQNLFIWPYQLHEKFAERVQMKKPIPLIITAHFALLLQNYEYIWFVKGWSDHVVAGVRKHLEPECQHWLKWPTEQARVIREAKDAMVSAGD